MSFCRRTRFTWHPTYLSPMEEKLRQVLGLRAHIRTTIEDGTSVIISLVFRTLIVPSSKQ